MDHPAHSTLEGRPKAIVVGASSGIGHAIARELSARGYFLGLTARRETLLHDLQKTLPEESVAHFMDVANPSEAIPILHNLIQEMGGMDLIVINSGINVGEFNATWEQEYETIKVNVEGFTALANTAIRYFKEKNAGHLVGISSIAGVRGNGRAPAYSASKAFVSNYLQGVSQRLCTTTIHVTDVRPGFVDTAMIRGKHGLFWVATCERAAKQIADAIEKKKPVVYITKRWGLIALLLRMIPRWLYHRGFVRHMKQDQKFHSADKSSSK